MTIQFGTFAPQGWRMDLVDIDDPIEQYEAMTQVAVVAEQSGYDSIWVYDHFHTVPTPEVETCFEAWTVTAALARDTTRINIGQMVTCNGYRSPALLAKMASTVDVLSHGRLYCGLGAGWYEHEWRAYGYGFPELRDRMRAFREATELVIKMWTEEKATYAGEYFTVAGAINEPKGVQKPHIPLWLGGSGERITLRLVAQHGSASNFGGKDLGEIRYKLDVLRRHCEDVGRDYNDLIRSTNLNIFLLEKGDDPVKATAKVRGETSFDDFARGYFIGTADEIGEQIQLRADLGMNYVITYFPRVAYDHTMMQRFATEIVPRFQ